MAKKNQDDKKAPARKYRRRLLFINNGKGHATTRTAKKETCRAAVYVYPGPDEGRQVHTDMFTIEVTVTSGGTWNVTTQEPWVAGQIRRSPVLVASGRAPDPNADPAKSGCRCKGWAVVVRNGDNSKDWVQRSAECPNTGDYCGTYESELDAAKAAAIETGRVVRFAAPQGAERERPYLAEPRVTETTGDVTIRQMLALTTGHLPEQFGTSGLDEIDGLVVDSTYHGWLMWVPDDPDDSAGGSYPPIPDVILNIQRYARLNGCGYVLFDTDFDVNPDLPYWSW